MELWLAVCTQWRAGGMGPVGLDYSEVRIWAAELEIDLSPGMWAKIRALERYVITGEVPDAEDDRAGHPQAAQGPGH